MSELEFGVPVINDRPSEWASIPERLLELLSRAGGILTPDERVAMNIIAASQWFLIRNETGARCGSCRQGNIPGAIHTYVTGHCIELPFNGLRECFTWLDTSKLGSAIKGVMRPGTLVPISAEMAAKLEQRIVQRGGRTVLQQQPVQRAEMDAAALARRMHQRAAIARPGLIRDAR